METEVIYADGSMSTFHEGGGSSHDGDLAIARLRLITAHRALDTYIKSNGAIELTRGGAAAAIRNVIAPITGKTYKRSMKGKREALEDCLALIAQIEQQTVVFDTEE